MNVTSLSVLLVISLAIFDHISHVDAGSKRDKMVYCGACIFLVQEMTHALSATDPKKKIQIGGHKQDSKTGRLEPNEITLKDSDLYLSELTESICRHLDDYGYRKSEQSSTGKILLRTKARPGMQPIMVKDFMMSEALLDSLRWACHTILEEDEDTLFDLLKDKAGGGENEQKLCADKLNYCTKTDVDAHIWGMAQAVMDGLMQEGMAPQWYKGEDTMEDMKQHWEEGQTEGEGNDFDEEDADRDEL